MALVQILQYLLLTLALSFILLVWRLIASNINGIRQGNMSNIYKNMLRNQKTEVFIALSLWITVLLLIATLGILERST